MAFQQEREDAQYQGVLNCKPFQDDPLGALEQHLKNSLKKQKETEKLEEEQKKKDGIVTPPPRSVMKAPKGKKNNTSNAKPGAGGAPGKNRSAVSSQKGSKFIASKVGAGKKIGKKKKQR